MTERAMRPFWVHQLAEYLIGIALVASGMQDPKPLVPTVAGALVIVNASIVRGPLGAFEMVGRKTHRWLDLFVMVFILIGALQPRVDAELTGRAIMLIVLIPMGFLWFYTDWDERPARAERRAAKASQSSEEFGRSAGRMAGNVYNKFKNR